MTKVFEAPATSLNECSEEPKIISLIAAKLAPRTISHRRRVHPLTYSGTFAF